ncbi:hypothetical protein [Ruminococcus flavefaciens]|nr:hypothetical protein [Ruminococcus flavefaciens]
MQSFHLCIPVSSIKAMVDYLELVSDNAEQKETLAAIKRQGQTK